MMDMSSSSESTRTGVPREKRVNTLYHAHRLYKLGFAIHWLHPKSKRPVESGWTTGPRKTWEQLEETYVNGYNVGVRLGTPSKIAGGFLAVIDVDIKSENPDHLREAIAGAKAILKNQRAPIVLSGRGNGSRHYYILTKSPFKTFNPAVSKEFVKVHMPSKKPSKAELRDLSTAEIDSGMRISKAWEISLYSDGRQVVLPPSVHPDSGEGYVWKRELEDTSALPVIDVETLFERIEPREKESVPEGDQVTERSGVTTLEDLDFKVEPVDLAWLPISDKVKAGIIHGTDVVDRSGYLLPASTALLSAGLNRNEVLTVLTDPDTYLGACAFEHAKTKSRKRAAEWVFKYTLARVETERSAEAAFSAAPIPEAARKLSPEEVEAQNAEFEEERSWLQDIARGGDKGQGAPKSLVGNVVLILKNAVAKDLVKRDEFAFRDTYSCDTPWGGKSNEVVSDDDVANIKYWLGQKFDFEPKKEVIYDALTVIACHNAYDPVRDMLDNLPAWDQVPRLDTWLAKNFEAEGDPEYLAQVFRKWMFAMVMRVYRPGAKFDWMPIFEGAQGVGKSSFGRVLVGDSYFLDWLPNLNDKDSALSLQGMWGVEMGELSQFRKNELENIKAFISRTVDKLRPPYGRRLMESARRCVFFGTTNRATYLTDDTGNRRFKPIIVGNLNFTALRRERLQLFAEAKWLFDNEKETELTLELSGQAKVYERQIHGEKMVEDDSNAMAEAMLDFIEKVKSERAIFDLKRFRILDLFDGVGPLTNWRPENRNLQFAAKMLKKMGGHDRFIKGRKFWGMGALADLEDPPPTQDFY